MENNNTPKPKVVHTFSDDMVGALGENPGSSLRTMIHEQEERDKEREALSPQNPENKIFIALSTLLLVLSLLGLLYVVFTRGEIVETQQKATPIIFVDRNQFVSIDNLNNEKAISALKSAFALSTVKQGGIEAFYLTRNKKLIQTDDFLDITALNMPGKARDMISPTFMVGVAKTSKNEPFILLKVRSFSDIFPFMQEWEDKMFYDLHDVFGISLGKDTNALLNKKFEDGFVQNKNARVLYQADGSVALMYVYADTESVIITRSVQAGSEVMRRLSGSDIRK